MESRLPELLAKCRCAVSVCVNEHRSYYESAATYLNELDLDDLDLVVKTQMIDRDTIVVVQAYPNTPVGFFRVVHWDLETAIAAVIAAIDTEPRRVVPASADLPA